MDAAPPIIVRAARGEDRAVIRDLTLAAYGQYATVMEPSAWSGLRQAIEAALAVDHGAQQLVAERSGEIVGSVLLFPPSADAYGDLGPRVRWPEIRALAVAPSARGLGVARLLVNECIRRAREAGADAIGLHTSPSMRDAIRLYEKFGFARDPALDIDVEGSEPIQAYRRAL
ncbi:MAG: GNAT family N-acetyltransferase [Gemmatimonadota bacterium]|nr:GNAT family N-acetyltransferase [Gemmatimonadota bacterium]